MKALLITFGFLFLVGCNKSDDTPITGGIDPIDAHLYFELLKTDNTVFENGEVEISGRYKQENGQLIPLSHLHDYWLDLTIVDESDLTPLNYPENTVLFGELQYATFDYGSNTSSEDSWLNEIYHLIRYQGKEIDTLLIKDILNPGFDRKFEFYLNDEQIELQEIFGYNSQGVRIVELGYITITNQSFYLLKHLF